MFRATIIELIFGGAMLAFLSGIVYLILNNSKKTDKVVDKLLLKKEEEVLDNSGNLKLSTLSETQLYLKRLEEEAKLEHKEIYE